MKALRYFLHYFNMAIFPADEEDGDDVTISSNRVNQEKRIEIS